MEYYNDQNNFINNSTLQQVFEKNQANLVNAYKAQNNNDLEESMLLLEECKSNFYLLGNLLDKINQSSIIYRDNREILSSEDIKLFISDYPNIRIPCKDVMFKKTTTSSKKPKQQKTKWTLEEEKLFRDGIDLYGKRSKYI
jgi:hypothetical protein